MKEVYSAQLITPETLHPASPLYNTDEMERLTRILSDFYNPEYIQLFGSLAGGTPHSEVMAYDLLIVTQNTPYYGWRTAKRILKLYNPPKRREIPYVNIYIVTPSVAEACETPYLWLARAEGIVLYRNGHYRFRRPQLPCDYAKAYAEAQKHLDTFLPEGHELMAQATVAFAADRLRQAAYWTGKAVEVFYRTLYFVFHGQVSNEKDIEIMHDRVRTLAVELMLILDNGHTGYNNVLPELKMILAKLRRNVEPEVNAHQMQTYICQVQRMAAVVDKVCKKRIELYKSRSGQ